MKRRPPVLSADPDVTPLEELARCFAEDWLTDADMSGPWHGPDDFGYHDRESVLLFRAWGRYRRAAREWEAHHPAAPRIMAGRPLWRGTPPS